MSGKKSPATTPRRAHPSTMSKDVFTAPSRLEQYPRLMRLRPVYEHHKLGKDDLWPGATIRSKVRDLLEPQQSADGHCSKVVELLDHETSTLFVSAGLRRTRKTRTSRMSPRTGQSLSLPSQFNLGGSLGRYSHRARSHSILPTTSSISSRSTVFPTSMLRTVSRWSWASVVPNCSPVSDLDPLKVVIDPVTTALGLPIAGLKTLKSQGTMGFYFNWVRSLCRHGRPRPVP
jgi:hypothetical protein